MLNFFGMRLVQGGFVKIPMVKPTRIDVQRLLVPLGGVQTGGQHERSVHLAAPICRQDVTAEIQQTVHEQHDGVLIAVAVATFCCVEQRMSIAA